jgi:hypothetical protein
VNREVDLHDDFVPEFRDLQDEVQDELLALVELIEKFGPRLGRPRADTLNGSRHPNMKELRFAAAGGVWRVAFAFDPNPTFSQVAGLRDAAQALVPAASALMPTLGRGALSLTRTRVETSLDTAGTSARATSVGGV